MKSALAMGTVGTEKRGSGLRRFWASDPRRRFTRNTLGMISLCWLLLVIVAVIIGPWFVRDPNVSDVLNRIKAPSAEFLAGTDQLGRDIFARILAGGRVSMMVALSATVLSVIFGVFLGVVSGYRGGLFDDITTRIFDVLLSFPTLLLGIMVIAAFGSSLMTVVIAISIATVPMVARLARAGAISVKPREYIQGVIALGIPTHRILLRHVLPNIIVPVLVLSTGNMGRLALAESGLSYVGAGIQPPEASWGNMIAEGQAYLQYAWWIPVIPGTVLTLVTLAFSFVGDALRDAFDVREFVGDNDAG
ncbi:ABC transporter permease [Sinorhizobium meliloti]|uniref:D-ala-D-ala transporter subunit n=1 Tax=Rhizobium meliloti TaxID=382 RepID=A0A2J0YYR7_RHIML|nr:ABC transporter permease [Sinorhizobium meliloti]PJR13425.1 D-ala-D-ala transporter subunit [Sinorhizobium meliloti]